jgi:hypothetical protein
VALLWAGGLDVQEVNLKPVDVGHELRDRVHARLVRRQSYSERQYSASSRAYATATPKSHESRPESGGQLMCVKR